MQVLQHNIFLFFLLSAVGFTDCVIVVLFGCFVVIINTVVWCIERGFLCLQAMVVSVKDL